MALIRTGQGITDIRGSISGCYFHRDKFGLHSSSHPRVVYKRTDAQARQRSAFSTARSFSQLNRVVSYNIYLALNSLPVSQPPPDYYPNMR